MAASRTPGVDLFFAGYASPILARAGFERHGRTYRRFAANGDAAVVNFQTSSGASQAAYAFHINLAVVPVPWRDWILRGAARSSAPPTAAEGLLQERLWPPGAWHDAWTIDSVDIGRELGRQLAAVLPPRLHELVTLLDRREFLRRVQDDNGLRTMQSTVVTEIVLLIDEGVSPELEQLLEQMQASRGSGPHFAAWARARLGRRPATPRR